MNARSGFAAAALAAAVAFAPATAGAWSLFHSEEKDLLAKAEAQFAAAEAAEAEGRVLDQADSLRFALRDYSRLSAEHPEFRSEYVRSRQDSVQSRLADLMDRIRRGEIAVPDPETVLQDAARGDAAPPAAAAAP
ncbi:MAG: hypothetical protein IJ783_02435, partial [Kiritimatiellae bacterium]|nr:hypothetical protein [Kiritimatiellia bacterium]